MMESYSNDALKSSVRVSPLRRLYNWVISWADSPYAAWALFILAFAESSFFPIPPDVLLMALCVARPRQAWRFALICLVGSVTGGMAGYFIGMFASQTVAIPILDLYDPSRAVFGQIQKLYGEWGFWGILAAAITPIPYKVFTIASGLLDYSFHSFVLASVVGRGFRFFAVAGLLYWGGERLKSLIEKYFDILSIVALVLLVGGFVLLKYLH